MLLDAKISTSAAHTYWMMGENEKALASIDRSRDFSGDEIFILESMGRIDEAIALIGDRERALLARGVPSNFIGLVLLRVLRAAFSGQSVDFGPMDDIDSFPDPEGLYYGARSFARAGRNEKAVATLDLMEQRGFYCYPALARDPWLDGLRGIPAFKEIMKRIEVRHHEARLAFEMHPGSRLLAVGTRR